MERASQTIPPGRSYDFSGETIQSPWRPSDLLGSHHCRAANGSRSWSCAAARRNAVRARLSLVYRSQNFRNYLLSWRSSLAFPASSFRFSIRIRGSNTLKIQGISVSIQFTDVSTKYLCGSTGLRTNRTPRISHYASERTHDPAFVRPVSVASPSAPSGPIPSPHLRKNWDIMWWPEPLAS